MVEKGSIVEARRLFWATWYVSDEQANEFFANGYWRVKSPRPLVGIPEGTKLEVIKELGAYAGPDNGFETWYVVKMPDYENPLLVHKDNVK